MKKPDPKLDALQRDPTAARLLQDTATLNALLNAPETQTLMELLTRQAGSSLQTAAQAAAQGDPSSLVGLLQQVTATGAGAQAVEGLKKRTGEP